MTHGTLMITCISQVKTLDVQGVGKFEPYRSSKQRTKENSLGAWLKLVTDLELQDKGARNKVRTGNWSSTSDLSADQKTYAALDGMASFVLGKILAICHIKRRDQRKNSAVIASTGAITPFTTLLPHDPSDPDSIKGEWRCITCMHTHRRTSLMHVSAAYQVRAAMLIVEVCYPSVSKTIKVLLRMVTLT